ncbi:hypothetical protein [Curtobacterium luteum]|uniref:hypothetical protein n=1 Tax=Curtobacterium luteum TaxID=33881 RepID=UPI000736E452|nr:hypothetical protein [Curtobacterium luteum]
MFVMTTNSASSMRLTDAFRPYREQIRFNLGQLDNDEDWAYQLWYVPDSAGWPDDPGYSDEDWNSRYIQAGGSAERMSVEIQRVEDGELRHYVVGRQHDVDEPLTETVNVAGTDHPVHPAEVFDADEATNVFLHYFQDSGTVPDGYVLRHLDLS